MKPPRAYARGILHFFGAIRRSTLLRLPCGVGSHSEALVSTVVSTPRGEPSFGGSPLRIHPWTYPAFVAGGYSGGVGRPWSSAKADK